MAPKALSGGLRPSQGRFAGRFGLMRRVPCQLRSLWYGEPGRCTAPKNLPKKSYTQKFQVRTTKNLPSLSYTPRKDRRHIPAPAF